MCEEVRQEANGNFFLIGVINLIRVPQLPVVAGGSAFSTAGRPASASSPENVRLIAPDQTTVMRKGEVKFELQDPAMHSTNVTVFGQLEFKTAGTYFIEVLVDDVMKLRYPVPVLLVPPQTGQNPPPAEPAP